MSFTNQKSLLIKAVRYILPLALRRGILLNTIFYPSKHSVVSGPFKGMSYVNTSIGSAYYAKLLGTYELELHSIIESICQLPPDLVINIGAAEGYYAIGLAIRCPAARIIAFEMDPDGQSLISRFATRNGVSSQITIHGECNLQALQNILQSSRRTVIICDVEGYEMVLLNPDVVPELATAYILVELHEASQPGVSEVIEERFQSSHVITHTKSIERIRADFPYENIYTRLLPSKYMEGWMSEYRVEEQTWFWMVPHSTEGDEVV